MVRLRRYWSECIGAAGLAFVAASGYALSLPLGLALTGAGLIVAYVAIEIGGGDAAA